MKRTSAFVAGLLVLLLAYLLLWPVPVDPVSWQAPQYLGLIDPFQPDERLKNITAVDMAPYSSPEDVTAGRDGALYATTAEGLIIRIDRRGKISTFAETGGRPLGIELASDGSLLVANAVTGLQRVSRDGETQDLNAAVAEAGQVTANDLAVASNGDIFFSESSRKFTAREFGGSYPASLLDLNEHGAHGYVHRYHADDGRVTTLLGGLNYANGVALSADEEFLVIAETGQYRILRLWLQGPRRGEVDTLIDNLPGFPDNINNGLNDRFWIGLVAPRSELLDRLSDQPMLRKILQRLPRNLRPSAKASSHVIAINGDGVVLMNLQDPEARYPSLTGVYETPDTLYFSSLFGHHLPKIDKRDL